MECEPGVFVNVGGAAVDDRRVDADFPVGPLLECVAAASDRTCNPFPALLAVEAPVEGPRALVAGVSF